MLLSTLPSALTRGTRQQFVVHPFTVASLSRGGFTS